MWWEIIKKGSVSLPEHIIPMVREILDTYYYRTVFRKREGIIFIELIMHQSNFEGKISNHYGDVLRKLKRELGMLRFETDRDENATNYYIETRYHPLQAVFDDTVSQTSFPVGLNIEVSSKEWDDYLELTDSAFSTAEQKLEALRGTKIQPKPLSQLDPQDRQTVRSIIEG